MSIVNSLEQLEALYGTPGETSLVKELDRLIPEYAAFIEASPFVALSTCGPEGLDCSPRGDLPGFVRVRDDRTLLMPDRRGNNRADSLKNIVRDGRVGLLFLVPGSGTTLRVNGRAMVSVDEDLRASFTVEGQPPRSVIAGDRALRPVESGQARRSKKPADARKNTPGHQPGADRRRRLRPRMAGTRPQDDVVNL